VFRKAFVSRTDDRGLYSVKSNLLDREKKKAWATLPRKGIFISEDGLLDRHPYNEKKRF
jgi:hypothetical protein